MFEDVTSGAQSDLQQATLLGREMVGRWGMSKAVGLVNVLGTHGGWGPWSADGPSEKTRELVDDEVRRLTDTGYDDALALLREQRAQLDSLAAALLAHKTLDEPDAYAAAGLARPLAAPESRRSSNPHITGTTASPVERTLDLDPARERSPS